MNVNAPVPPVVVVAWTETTPDMGVVTALPLTVTPAPSSQITNLSVRTTLAGSQRERAARAVEARRRCRQPEGRARDDAALGRPLQRLSRERRGEPQVARREVATTREHRHRYRRRHRVSHVVSQSNARAVVGDVNALGSCIYAAARTVRCRGDNNNHSATTALMSQPEPIATA